MPTHNHRPKDSNQQLEPIPNQPEQYTGPQIVQSQTADCWFEQTLRRVMASILFELYVNVHDVGGQDHRNGMISTLSLIREHLTDDPDIYERDGDELNMRSIHWAQRCVGMDGWDISVEVRPEPNARRKTKTNRS
jgi:hypothetical protein